MTDYLKIQTVNALAVPIKRKFLKGKGTETLHILNSDPQLLPSIKPHLKGRNFSND